MVACSVLVGLRTVEVVLELLDELEVVDVTRFEDVGIVLDIVLVEVALFEVLELNDKVVLIAAVSVSSDPPPHEQ